MNTLAVNNIKGAIFDMDGVLFDTEVLYERFWCEAARQFGFLMTPRHVAAIRSTDSGIAAEILRDFFGPDFDYAAIRERRKKLMSDYVNLNGIEMKRGVFRTLRYLKEKRNFRIALATTSNHKRAEKYLSMNGIRQYFDQLVCADMIVKGKPDPMIYLTAAERLGLKPAECIAFEDSFNGVRSAYQAGCITYMVPDRDAPIEEMYEKAYAVLEHMDQILEEYMKNIKMIALDLDGTTLQSDGTLSEITEKAIGRAAASGIEVVVASGRSYQSLPDAVRKNPYIRYAITSNGASVNRFSDGMRICSHTLQADAVIRIAEWLKKIKYPIEVFIDGQAYANKAYVDDPFRYVGVERVVSYVKKTRKPVDDIISFLVENCGNIDSISIVCKDDAQKILFYEELEKNYKEQVYVTSSVPHLIEICDSNGGKGAALSFLSEYLQISMENTAAFGNADNDVDMLRIAGLGVAVSNSSEKCLEAADIVAKSNDDNGVAETILKFL